MNRQELHKLLDELPEEKLKLFKAVLKEAINHEEVALDKDTYAFLLQDEDDWWKKPIKEEAE